MTIAQKLNAIADRLYDEAYDNGPQAAAKRALAQSLRIRAAVMYGAAY